MQSGLVNDEIVRLRAKYPDKPLYVVVEVSVSGGFCERLVDFHTQLVVVHRDRELREFATFSKATCGWQSPIRCRTRRKG